MRRPVLVIAGPTASGKSEVAVSLAQRLGGEIIGADSMQVYRGLDVGTAKPDAGQRAAVPHHMIDVADIWDDFSVSLWKQGAAEAAREILSRGRLPILCGGTGQYISALLHNLNFCAPAGDAGLRAGLLREVQDLGGRAMLERLALVDPDAAAGLHENDTGRIVRALEMAESGVTKSEQNRLSRGEKEFDFCVCALGFLDRQRLYDRINRRTDAMPAAALLSEAELVMKYPDSTAAQAIGYKELFPCFRGADPSEALEAVKQATRNYAKRQLTWLRRMPEVNWIYTDVCPDVCGAAEEIFRAYGGR